MTRKEAEKKLIEITGLMVTYDLVDRAREVEAAIDFTFEKWNLIREHPDLAGRYAPKLCALCMLFFRNEEPPSLEFSCHDADGNPCPLSVRWKNCLTGPRSVTSVHRMAVAGVAEVELVGRIDAWIGRMSRDIEAWREGKRR